MDDNYENNNGLIDSAKEIAKAKVKKAIATKLLAILGPSIGFFLFIIIRAHVARKQKKPPRMPKAGIRRGLKCIFTAWKQKRSQWHRGRCVSRSRSQAARSSAYPRCLQTPLCYRQDRHPAHRPSGRRHR